MPDQTLFSGSKLTAVRVLALVVLGMLCLGVVRALVTYPSRQLAVAALCVLATLPIVWVGLGRQLTPFQRGVSAGAYLRSGVPAVLVIALLAVGGWMFSLAPVS